MCFNSVTVKVPFSHRTIKVPCGKCSACLGVKASKRAKRIRSHHPAGFTCWFVTLTYDNNFLPFIKKSDLLAAKSDNDDFVSNTEYEFYEADGSSSRLSSNPSCPVKQVNEVSKLDGAVSIPIYRNSSCRWYRSRLTVQSEECVIGSLSVPVDALRHVSPDYLDSHLLGYRHKVDGVSVPHPDNVSVTYYDDVKNFFKRLRDYLKSHYGTSVPLSYYSTSEYGPTTSRLHYHLALWLPSYIGYSEVCSFVCKAWPFCDSDRLRKYIETAVCVSDYIASYLNCDSSVSRFLTFISPPRCSHSLYFGFDKMQYDFQYVHAVLSNGLGCSFIESYMQKGKGFVESVVSFPKYVVYKYFPFVKGFSRLDDNTLLHILKNSGKHIVLSKKAVVKFRSNGDAVYHSNILDINGVPLDFSEKELEYMRSNIESRYVNYWSGYNRYDFAFHVIALLRNFQRSHFIRLALQSKSVVDTLYLYDNISQRDRLAIDLSSIDVSQYGLSESLLSDSDYFPASRISNDWYSNKYLLNIKYRKLNSVSS